MCVLRRVLRLIPRLTLPVPVPLTLSPRDSTLAVDVLARLP